MNWFSNLKLAEKAKFNNPLLFSWYGSVWFNVISNY